MRNRERTRRRIRTLSACVFLLLVLSVAISVSPGIKMQEMLAGTNEMLFSHILEQYFAGCSFLAEEQMFRPGQWIAGQAMKAVPLGAYVSGCEETDTDIEDSETYRMILAQQAADENAVDEQGNLIGDVKETQASSAAVTYRGPDLSPDKLKNYEYLVGNFYTVDSTTLVKPEELNAEILLAKDMRIDKGESGPKVLIYHTHSQEAFADSIPGDTSTTIMGMGEYLTQLLNAKGIPTIHHTGVYDLQNGKMDRSNAYQLAEGEIRSVLKQHPGIEVVIDLHRDGVAKTTHLVTEIGGKQTAQIMFFNGLSRTRANGDISYLKNPYIEDNLAFSLQMHLKALEMYPGFTRRIYLKGYRYNMHLKPKTLLVEAGAQTNTVAEMKNAMVLLAEILHRVLDP